MFAKISSNYYFKINNNKLELCELHQNLIHQNKHWEIILLVIEKIPRSIILAEDLQPSRQD